MDGKTKVTKIKLEGAEEYKAELLEIKGLIEDIERAISRIGERLSGVAQTFRAGS